MRQMNIDPKTAWLAMREIMTGFDAPKTISMRLNKPNGEEAMSSKEKAAECVRHFKQVYNNCKHVDPEIFEELREIMTYDIDHKLGEPPTFLEVCAAVRKLKNGKSPGPTGMSPDALKALDNDGLFFLHEFMCRFWKGDDDNDFDSWREMILTILPKAGKKDYTTLNSWRGIMLKELPAKVMSSFISMRLLLHLGEVELEIQYGSTPKKGCADALFCIKLALQLRKQQGLDTWALFIDLVKAYDTADHDTLWKLLLHYGVPDTVVNVLRRLYTNFKIKFDIEGEKCEIDYGVGVQQGDNVAPVLFIFLLNAVFQHPRKKVASQKTRL
jgi:hypothetical protein